MLVDDVCRTTRQSLSNSHLFMLNLLCSEYKNKKESQHVTEEHFTDERCPND